VLRKEDGCVLAVAKNITAEKDAQDQLRLLLDAANMGFWDWNIQTGAISWSPSLERLFGLAPNTFDGTFETLIATVHPDDRERTHQATQHSHRQERTATSNSALQIDGSIRWMESKGRVFFDEMGKPVRAIRFNLDITERKLAEEQLRQSEEQLRLALDAANMGFWGLECSNRNGHLVR
jgi:PAS domain S-box-containing protein